MRVIVINIDAPQVAAECVYDHIRYVLKDNGLVIDRMNLDGANNERLNLDVRCELSIEDIDKQQWGNDASN